MRRHGDGGCNIAYAAVDRHAAGPVARRTALRFVVAKSWGGAIWFVGRKDDIVNSGGHLIGPLEVESALTDHPTVAEAAVIGVPDPTAAEVAKAFVTLKSGFVGDEDLRLELLGHARKRLGATVAPKQIVFADALPHTGSRKIMRRLLKARELELPEGDTSTIEQLPQRHVEEALP